MKKILFSIAAISSILAACSQTPQYSIKGTVVGDQVTGNAILVKTNGRNLDTLAKAPISNGKFELTGNTATTIDAFVVIEGQKMGLPIILENANYTATVNFTNPVENKIEGTENQAVINKLIAISTESKKAQGVLYEEYQVAVKANDTAKMMQIKTQFSKLGEEAVAKEEALLNEHSDSFVAAYLLANKANKLDFEDLEKRFEALGPNAKASSYGQKIAERIKVMKVVAVGQVAPDFTLNTPDGKPLSMHSIKAKVKIIDFWASWCGPCRRENPNVVKIYEEFHGKGLEILGVSLDQKREEWLKAIEDDKLVWNHVSDLKGWGCEASKLYAVSGIPHMVILDENNVIVAKNLRGEALRNKVAEMLK